MAKIGYKINRNLFDAILVVAHSESRASMRPTDDQNSNSEVQEIPESRATINNFVSIAHPTMWPTMGPKWGPH